jgi:hypothetical protein
MSQEMWTDAFTVPLLLLSHKVSSNSKMRVQVLTFKPTPITTAYVKGSFASAILTKRLETMPLLN